MATIAEKLQSDLDLARQDVNEASAKVTALEGQLANLPQEVSQIPETEWERIKEWFKAL